MSKTYTVQMVIETIDEETGERSRPSDVVTDAVVGLDADQALAHHYGMKSAYARMILALGKDADGDKDAMVKACE